MLFTPTEIPDAYLVDLERRVDERGFFARGWCAREFEEHGISGDAVQMNISYNKYKHTLRGFHYQVRPHQEQKLLRCIRGAIYDVLLDLRPNSPSFMKHIAVGLSAENQQMLVVPKGCANAFLTLKDETEVTYLVSEFYSPDSERGVRWDDPSFGVQWPIEPAVISEKDANWQDFTVQRANEKLAFA